MKKEDLQTHLFEHLKNTKILLYSVILALLIGITGMAVCIKNLNTEINTKSYQINLLIDEVGDIKNENQYLYQTIVKDKDRNQESFRAMNEIYLILQTYVEERFNEKLKLNDNELSNLSRLMREKEHALAELQNRNSQLSEEVAIKTKNEDILTFLILGTDGHLTDTIMLANVNDKKESITLISIPRDLYINGRKINSILPTYGIEKLKRDIYSVTGVYPDKYFMTDIGGFREIIDLIGGVEVDVKEDIHDPYFPTGSNGYKVYSVSKGLQNMSGEEALMYVRSRKTTSDFDRSKRQQQVIQAVRVRLKTMNIFENLDTAKDLFTLAIKNTDTDIDLFEGLYFMKNYQNFPINSGNVIDTTNFLYASRTRDGQYILLPKDGTFYNIKVYISNLINR